MFRDRIDAGKKLAKKLEHYAGRDDTVVLALPRGGVVVGFEIATTLNIPLDVLLVRKLGVPGHRELAMGAIASGGMKILNEEIVKSLHISSSEIEATIKHEQEIIKNREKLYRGSRDFIDLKNKTTILADDGIATGATMRVAISAIKKSHANSKVVVAAPVAPKDMYNILSKEADEFICLEMPENFVAISKWYESFYQTSDDEVISLLSQAQKQLSDKNNHSHWTKIYSTPRHPRGSGDPNQFF